MGSAESGTKPVFDSSALGIFSHNDEEKKE